MNKDILTIILAVIGSGVINVILNRIFTSHDRKNTEQDDVKKALRLIIKDRLRYLCTHYIGQGWIYADELEDLIAMHEIYHTGLRGNGYLDELMKKVKTLEIRGIGVK